MAKAIVRSGRKAGKRGNPLPWVKPGHNGIHPTSTLDTIATRRNESGSKPKPRVMHP